MKKSDLAAGIQEGVSVEPKRSSCTIRSARTRAQEGEPFKGLTTQTPLRAVHSLSWRGGKKKEVNATQHTKSVFN